ncbi:MAG: hypothetical protein JSR56_10775 [Proteobacteria bacterium]|nr:hypothetical protein [Pseudomonadota bacterium]
MTLRNTLRMGLSGGVLLVASLAVVAAPPAAPGSASATARLQAQQKDVDAKLVAARARHDALQAEMTQLEQHNALQKKQLQQRDSDIASLQQQLRAAGAPASALSSAPASH